MRTKITHEDYFLSIKVCICESVIHNDVRGGVSL